VYEKAAQIADLMAGEDVEADLKVLRDARKACHHFYDTKKKKLVRVPDHKTRLAVTTLSRAYHEGRPVERKEALTADVMTFQEKLRRLRESDRYKQLQNSEQAMTLVEGLMATLPDVQAE
jgi:hypothetical protein